MEFTDEDYKEIIYQSRSSYIKEMVDLLGMDSTLKFVRLFEGQTVTIPRFTNRNTSNKIKSLLGEKIARTLSFHFGECGIHVLSLSEATYKAGIQKRNREIADKA
ncbi:hypothetical protein V1993_18430, partial [Pseudomonas aeruginosa]